MIQKRPQRQFKTEESMEQLDPVSKRRLQNRLNQRASRKRKQAERQKEQREHRWIIYTNETRGIPAIDDVRGNGTPEPSPVSEDSPISQDLNGLSCSNSPLSPAQYFHRLRRHLVEGAGEIPPSPSLIHSVTQFNIIRAMFQNAATMDLTMEALREDIASLFNVAGPITFHLPPSLQPSSTQKQIIHHPWIDLLPIRSFRNTLILKMSKYDDEELCADLYGLRAYSGQVGMIVWGESWDPRAYELSEEVVQKWSWMLKDSPELLVSTNFWRKKRGEKALRLPEPSEHFIHEIE